MSIAIVVFFHAYGMTYANHFPADTAIVFRNLYDRWVSGGPILVAMPMFVFISGFLFGCQLQKTQPPTLKSIINRKFMRLMVPFFVFTIIFMVSTNSMSWKPVYQWTYWHLWFLPMLFWCFVITYLLRPFIFSGNYVVSVSTLIVLFGLSLVKIFMPPFIGLHGVHLWICWFALGTWFSKHESMLDSRVVKINLVILGSFVCIMLGVLYPQEYGTNTVVGHIISLSGMMALWSCVNLISWRNNVVTSSIVGLSGASFGIYIFHNWIEMYMVSQTAQRVFPLERFALNHTLLFPFMFSIIAFILSYVLSWAILKTKVGKGLIG